MRAEQTVKEMSEEVLARQAKAMVAQTGQLFESALETVSSTEAGQQLRELANGEHRHEKSQDWQVGVPSERVESRPMPLNASAVRKIRGIHFCESCARKQEAYFAIGKAHDAAARVSV
jgi:hypothetical protein